MIFGLTFKSFFDNEQKLIFRFWFNRFQGERVFTYIERSECL